MAPLARRRVHGGRSGAAAAPGPRPRSRKAKLNLIETESEKSMPFQGKTDSDSVQTLIHQQAADGSFKFDSIFQDLLGLSLEKIQAACPQDISSNAWLTALAVALLTKKFSMDKNLCNKSTK